MSQTSKLTTGQAFRKLNVGEVIQNEDEIFSLDDGGKWLPITGDRAWCVGQKWDVFLVPFRRRVTQESEVETLRMQLAACGVAAIDGSRLQSIKPGSPYYTPAYEDIIKLRRYADSARKVIADVLRHMPGLNLPSFLQHNLDYPEK